MGFALGILKQRGAGPAVTLPGISLSHLFLAEIMQSPRGLMPRRAERFPQLGTGRKTQMCHCATSLRHRRSG